jgi:hypothetical protein
MDLLNKLAKAEAGVLARSFVAPVHPGARVQVRVERIVWSFQVVPAGFTGWAVLQPVDYGRAEVVGRPRLTQVRDYLELLRAVPVVLCEQRRGVWFGLAADPAVAGRGELLPVYLTRDGQPFDTVRARWDGRQLLFEGRDPRRNPSVAQRLRKALAEEQRPDSLARGGLLPGEREVYRRLYGPVAARQQGEAERENDRRLAGVGAELRAAVEHADGRLHSFVERDDHYRVTFDVDGATHTSTVRKGDHEVMLAGICLSDQDQKFDLTSLVGVIREGQQEDLWEDGDGLPEDVFRELPLEGSRRWRG